MPVCEEIRQSVDVNVPAAVANEEWTQFLFWNVYHRPLGPDESDAEPGAGFVRLEAVDEKTTRVTVDLNYCARFRGLSDSDEIAQVESHLRDTLATYKAFVESRESDRNSVAA
jgi:hypothetical protein